MSKIDFSLRKNTRLEDRSYLCFEFYGTNGEVTRRFLPFFQNPEVEESKKANYVKYQPLGRNGTIFTYTGAESRAYNLNFRITLPAVLEYKANWRGRTFAGTKVISDKEYITMFKVGVDAALDGTYWAAKGNATDFDNYFKDIKSQDVTTIRSSSDGSVDSGKISENERLRTIDIIMYWINMIRSSTLNNSERPTYGPPIIRLNHGIMHQDVPCVCMDYKINIDDGAGYDLTTMLPRVIQVSMNLMEHRVGNFKKYNVTKVDYKDNIVGWESIIGGTNTIDPIRDDIGRKWTQ